MKCAQATYLLDRIHNFRSTHQSRIRGSPHSGPSTRGISIVLGGDFNSTPDSELYRIFTSLFSTCACVYDLSIENRPGDASIAERYLVGSYFGGPDTKFLCDPSLSKLCRWLRVLGLNAALYTPPAKADTLAESETLPAQKEDSVQGIWCDL